MTGRTASGDSPLVLRCSAYSATARTHHNSSFIPSLPHARDASANTSQSPHTRATPALADSQPRDTGTCTSRAAFCLSLRETSAQTTIFRVDDSSAAAQAPASRNHGSAACPVHDATTRRTCLSKQPRSRHLPEKLGERRVRPLDTQDQRLARKRHSRLNHDVHLIDPVRIVSLQPPRNAIAQNVER